ncbi:uncharacterized protein [Musca autumnalis]|uniref:uncharacterized protein n=1 Tax=Musca autumnalis TaxID=221902 RepID=UPI003CEE300E
MQTAVDCNGSSISNGSTTTTTITTIETETGNGGETMTQHMLVQATANGNGSNRCSSSTSSNTVTTTTTNTNNITTDHHAHEVPMAVLRHRVTSATSANAVNSSDTNASKAPKNGLTHLIDANDYLGNTAECKSMMATMPSSTQQLSSSTKDKINLPDSALGEKFQINTSSTLQPQPPPSPPPSPGSCSSSSKTTSNSTSTTSSVIATPILRRNGNVLKEPQPDDNTKTSAQAVNANGSSAETGQDGTTFREPPKIQPQQLIKNQMLPLENTSFALECGKREMSSDRSLLQTPTTTKTMSSSTTSSSINSNASSSSASVSASSSSVAGSATETTTTTSSITPPASATTPALLSPSSSTGSTTPSSSSAPSSPGASGVSSMASSSASMKGFSNVADFDAELLQWQDMPQYLQFNPYVLKGYRPLQTFKGCLLSLFYWHNETINILTHAIPIVYILAIVPGLMPWESGYRFLSFCHVFGSVAPWCGSFVYHLFMNIERGENVYYTLLKLDMVGIWVSQSFGALPFVMATTFCFTLKWRTLVVASYCLFSLWGLYKALTASSPWQRRLCFALPFSMRSILIFLRTLGLVGGNPFALSHVYLQDAVSIIGGAIGAMRIPEKWLPGLVDFYLNSHNIMHVLVVIAVYSMHMATIKDFEWMSNTNCEAFTNVSSKVLESTLNTNIEL